MNIYLKIQAVKKKFQGGKPLSAVAFLFHLGIGLAKERQERRGRAQPLSSIYSSTKRSRPTLAFEKLWAWTID